MKKKEIRVRCWVNVDGERFFGPGPAELLHLIDDTGSISKAARSMGMSYKKAWDIVDNLNSRGREPYVISQKGGDKGGGAQLTARGKRIVTAYDKLNAKVIDIVSREKELLKLI